MDKLLVFLVKSFPRESMAIYGTLRSLLYRGDEFICPCCEGGFRKLFPYGVKPRPNAQCPRCFSLETHRLIWLYLHEKTNIFKNELKLLHIAPEYAFQRTLESLPNLEYTSADLKSPLAAIKMDIAQIPYEDNAFDAILCIHVLEHVVNDRKALGELFRVLRPGGWAIIQSALNPGLEKTVEAPAGMSAKERAKKLGWKDHARIYGRDYAKLLTNAGFKVRVDDFIKTPDREKIKKYALTENEEIYFCQKP